VEREPLSRERVARAALALIDRSGLAGLSMRNLGAELGVEAMSLYKHVANKEALLQAVVELALESVRPADSAASWTDQLRHLARAFRAMGHAHAEVFGLVVQQLPVSSAALVPVEATLAALRASGLDDDTCAHMFWVIVAYISGSVLGEVGAGADPAGTFTFAPAALDSQAFPHLAALAPRLAQCRHDDEFEYGIDVMLREIAQLASRERTPRRRSAKRI
jgi:AcrR family transcriptional regulator